MYGSQLYPTLMSLYTSMLLEGSDCSCAGTVARRLQACTSAADLVNLRTKTGFTALMRAAQESHAEGVGALLKVDACRLDVHDKDGSTALNHAASHGRSQIVRQLLNALQPSMMQSALHYQDGHGYTPLQSAVSSGCTSTVGLLLSASHGQAALGICDAQGDSPLHEAAIKGHAAVAAQLLQASPSADIINLQNMRGFTPLMYAAQMGHSAVVKKLLEIKDCRADIQGRDRVTASSLARKAGHEEMALLVQKAMEVKPIQPPQAGRMHHTALLSHYKRTIIQCKTQGLAIYIPAGKSAGTRPMSATIPMQWRCMCGSAQL